MVGSFVVQMLSLIAAFVPDKGRPLRALGALRSDVKMLYGFIGGFRARFLRFYLVLDAVVCAICALRIELELWYLGQ